MIGEDDGSVALGNASHSHMENAMGSLNVMLLQPKRREEWGSMEQFMVYIKKKKPYNSVFVAKASYWLDPRSIIHELIKSHKEVILLHFGDLFLYYDEPGQCSLFLYACQTWRV